MNNEYVVETKNLTKQYRKKVAVNEVNMKVKKGAIYGLIGRNGAGKTTIMKMISGLATPTDGEVVLFGGEKDKNFSYKRLGVLIEAPGLYPGMSAYDNLKCKAICLGIANYDEEINSLLEIVGLLDVKKKKVKTYSLGMKQRLGIAMSMLASPDLLVLDEPINGLDPQGIAEVRDLILKINKEKNVTIIISSHILEELIKIVTDITIMHEGVIIEEMTKEEFLEKCKEKLEIIVDDVDKAATIIEEFGIRNYKVVSKEKIQIFEGLDNTSKVNSELVKKGVEVKSMILSNEGIEDYFIGLTGK